MMFRIVIFLAVFALVHCAASQASAPDSTIKRLQALEGNNAAERKVLTQLQGKLGDIAGQLQQLETQVLARLQMADQNRSNRDLAKRQQRTRTEPPRPVVYAVPVEGDPYLGKRYAKVTMVVAFEFGCSYCQKVVPMLRKLKKAYGRDLKIVYKQFLLIRNSELAERAVCAAHLQNKYFTMYRLLWKNGFDANRRMPLKDVIQLARSGGLNIRHFKRDLGGETCLRRLAKHKQQLSAVGVKGVPTFFINGRKITGAQPEPVFREIIDQERKKANAVIGAGTPLKNYYDTILATGKKQID